MHCLPICEWRSAVSEHEQRGHYGAVFADQNIEQATGRAGVHGLKRDAHVGQMNRQAMIDEVLARAAAEQDDFRAQRDQTVKMSGHQLLETGRQQVGVDLRRRHHTGSLDAGLAYAYPTRPVGRDRQRSRMLIEIYFHERDVRACESLFYAFMACLGRVSKDRACRP